MALLDDILKWTESDLPLWQRDAVRRLFTQVEGLTESDYDELYGLMKAANGLPNPLNLGSKPLVAQHLPAVPRPGPAAILRSMHDLRNVNRIAPVQVMNFSPTGMTVIYGGNGAGKSGYARVMKRACRARDQLEKVHPDASDPSTHTRIPEAVFDIELKGVAQQVKWTAQTVSPEELSTVVVFDSHCARAYLTAEQDIAYLPYGLDVVENLANKVLPELSRRLDNEITAVNVDCLPFAHLLGETVVGRMIADLTKNTDPAKIKVLATLTDQDKHRIAELHDALSEADPKAKAKEFHLSVRRLKELAIRVEAAMAWVSVDAITKLRNLTDSASAATQAEMLAAESFRSGENLLPGTGELVWKALFEAARTFSAQIAYPEHKFPHTNEGAVCPLCQQVLSDKGERLKRFEKYIEEDAAKVAIQARQLLEAAKSKIERANLTITMDNSLVEELSLLDSTIASITHIFETAIEIRRTWMLKASASNSWVNVPDLSENPRRKLRGLAARQLKAARTFDKASNEAAKKKLKIERDELQARQNLKTSLEAVLALVERMKLKSSLENCKNGLRTRPISEKSKEFASNAVSSSLKSALDNEFKTLGIGHIETKLKGRNDKGKMKYQLVLALPTPNRLDEILSEGEQRAIALGSFLAEIKLANHSGAIVFDDPVSSLDHWRRKNVAKRLAELAKLRQVIVLTHDTAFLGQLRDEIDTGNVIHTIQTMECLGNNPGYISEGLPWDHQGYKARIDSLEQAQKRFEKLPWPIYPDQNESAKMRMQYSRLRATIERVIQDVVFNGVVQRYRDWIIVDNLKEVVGFEMAEYQTIRQLYLRCCDVTEAHDPSSAQNASVPSANDFKSDIEALKKVISVIHSRQKNAKKASNANQGS